MRARYPGKPLPQVVALIEQRLCREGFPAKLMRQARLAGLPFARTSQRH
jgi:hypothetical protein